MTYDEYLIIVRKSVKKKNEEITQNANYLLKFLHYFM